MTEPGAAGRPAPHPPRPPGSWPTSPPPAPPGSARSARRAASRTTGCPSTWPGSTAAGRLGHPARGVYVPGGDPAPHPPAPPARRRRRRPPPAQPGRLPARPRHRPDLRPHRHHQLRRLPGHRHHRPDAVQDAPRHRPQTRRPRTDPGVAAPRPPALPHRGDGGGLMTPQPDPALAGLAAALAAARGAGGDSAGRLGVTLTFLRDQSAAMSWVPSAPPPPLTAWITASAAGYLLGRPGPAGAAPQPGGLGWPQPKSPTDTPGGDRTPRHPRDKMGVGNDPGPALETPGQPGVLTPTRRRPVDQSATPAAKRCTGPDCGQVKPLAEFHRATHMPDGHMGRCRECVSTYDRNRREAARAAVFDYYGRACACCDAADDLTIDHVNGGGAEHRLALFGSSTAGGVRFWRWLMPRDSRPATRRCASRATAARARAGVPDRPLSATRHEAVPRPVRPGKGPGSVPPPQWPVPGLRDQNPGGPPGTPTTGAPQFVRPPGHTDGND